jgi:hypothetical protein
MATERETVISGKIRDEKRAALYLPESENST